MTADSGADAAAHYLFERYQDNRRSRLLRTYYLLRPAMPRRLQIALRRAYVLRQGRRRFPAWPIEDVLLRHQHAELRRRLRDHGAARLPLVNFWPGDHRFAFVLTHDVEGRDGLAHIHRLREIEQRHGFVSAWNFCAEQYPIPHGLFEELRRDGCEIGLHGIDHRGELFASRLHFDAGLPKIRHYLREWGAAGFRSPSLHRNADWMPEIGCSYDSSFPDTDPFEPQAGGCCSIFPFMNGALVELPVTLAQDHTLFEILRHHDIGVWTRKGAWIIRHRGLINVIVHPDYMSSAERLGLYEQLLAFLAAQPDGWHALPREVAEWWRTRCGLRCEAGAGEVRIAGPGADRATVVYAREEGEEIVIGG